METSAIALLICKKNVTATQLMLSKKGKTLTYESVLWTPLCPPGVYGGPESGSASKVSPPESQLHHVADAAATQ